MWTDEVFDEFYVRVNRFNDPGTDSRETDTICNLLELQPDHEILDLPCGYGRHAVQLKKRGFSVTGIEYHPAQIEAANDYMAKMETTFPIFQGDMRNIPTDKQYDRIYCYFGSFGYFSEEENEKVIGEFYRALKLGGLFLLDVVNHDWIIRNFRPGDITRRPDGSILLEERVLDIPTGRINGRFTLVEKSGEILERSYSMQLYALHELVKLFTDKGFTVKKAVDGNNREFTLDSRRINIVGQK